MNGRDYMATAHEVQRPSAKTRSDWVYRPTLSLNRIISRAVRTAPLIGQGADRGVRGETILITPRKFRVLKSRVRMGTPPPQRRKPFANTRCSTNPNRGGKTSGVRLTIASVTVPYPALATITSTDAARSAGDHAPGSTTCQCADWPGTEW